MEFEFEILKHDRVKVNFNANSLQVEVLCGGEIWQVAGTKFIIFQAPCEKLEPRSGEEVKHISNESLRVSTWTTFQLFPS